MVGIGDPFANNYTSQAVRTSSSNMGLILNSTRRTPSWRLALGLPGQGNARRAPPQRCSDAGVCGRTTTAIHGINASPYRNFPTT